MSLQGPLIVVAEQPATELVQALSTAGAFPIVESKWADAPAAFVTVEPAAIVIAEPGAPANIASARMLCLQVATVNGPIVPVIARVHGDEDAAVPIALPADATLPVDRLLARLQFAMSVNRKWSKLGGSVADGNAHCAHARLARLPAAAAESVQVDACFFRPIT